jgi:CRP-like cAMP-binding protein
LTAAQRARIKGHGRVRRFEPGEVLLRAGDPAVWFFVVTAGRLEAVREWVAGEELLIDLGPGHFSGEINMLAGDERSPLFALSNREKSSN